MRKWRVSFRTVVQETKFDWRFLIERRTRQTPTDNSQRIRLLKRGVGGWRESLRENRFGALGRKTERDHSRLGLQFFLHYVLFFRNLGSPKGRACENESFFCEVTNLKLAVSKPDYCDTFFYGDSKKWHWSVLHPAYFSQPVKIRVTNSGSCFVRTNESKVAWRTLLTEWQRIR